MNTVQIARLLQCSPHSIYRYVKREENPLPHIVLSKNRFLFDVAVVRQWLDELGGYETETLTLEGQDEEVPVGD